MKNPIIAAVLLPIILSLASFIGVAVSLYLIKYINTTKPIEYTCINSFEFITQPESKASDQLEVTDSKIDLVFYETSLSDK